MKIGVSLRSGYPVTDAREGARWMVERARAASAAGLDSLFVGDHHAVPVAYYQNSPILGRLLAEWDDRPVGALYLLPLWNPVLVAEQVGTLASIARGRFILQCAIGGGPEQFASMGADIGRRPSAFESALDVIRRLCAGETVTTDNPGAPSDVSVRPIPPEPLEVWIGGHAPAALDRAARLGDVWLAGPDPTVERASGLLEGYRERCEVHGRSPSTVAIRRDIHVGADDNDALRVAGPVLDAGYRGFEPGVCVVGGPETVAEQFRELGRRGFTDVIIRHVADDHPEVLASFERLARVKELVSQG